MTANDNEWQQLTTSSTINDNEWYSKWQRMTASGKTIENEWEQGKERDFGFRMKQNMQFTTKIYSGI